MKQGWEIAEFEKCLEKVTYTNKIQRKDFKEEGIYPIVSQEKEFINGYWDNEDDLFKVDKPVVIFGDHTQVLKFIEFDFVLGADGVKILKTTDTFDSKYFYYFLQNIDLGSLGYARHYRLLKEIDVVYPKSLTEQQRIVSILDEAFAAIAKAKAKAEQNLKNSKELFESYLQGVFENGNWETKEFGEVISVLTDYHANGSYQILKKNVELKETEGFAWMVRSTDFENNFENDFRFINENSYNFLSKSKVFGGEIIMSKIGNAGNVYFMPRIDRPCSLAMNLFLIRLNEKKATPEFVFKYLKSYSGEFQIKSRLQGATTKTITKDNVRNIVIPLPTLNEQQTIVRQLDALRAETQKLEAVYQKKIADLEELKKSILQKAFSGELRAEKEIAV
jgi:type I restriction enzyme S subunit